VTTIPKTFNDLRQSYTRDELSHFPGNNELRFRVFSPFLKNLFQNKVVYCEKFICIVRLEDIQITPEYFKATAVPHLHIKRSGSFQPVSPTTPWSFTSTWDWMLLGNHTLSVPYAGWRIWPEVDFVREIEHLAQNGDHEAALQLLFD
jgi:hypothetical protein